MIVRPYPMTVLQSLKSIIIMIILVVNMMMMMIIIIIMLIKSGGSTPGSHDCLVHWAATTFVTLMELLPLHCSALQCNELYYSAMNLTVDSAL